MFCFCFQSPALKLQALEADAGPPSPAPEDSRDQKNLSAHQQPLLTSLQADHMPFLHSPLPAPVQDVVDSSRLAADWSPSGPAPSDASPPGDDAAPSSSPGSDSSPPLLSSFTSSECPVPSPRCPNLSRSLRYNLDPDSAPSPPCSQHIRMARCSVRAAPDDGSSSVSLLKRHVQTLRRRIRQLEERFEQEKLKPSYYDKTAHPEVARLITELLQSRKQLKELKSCHVKEGVLNGGANLRRDPSGSDGREAALSGPELEPTRSNIADKPGVDDTLRVITGTLEDRRRELGLPDSVEEMNRSQMSLEKSSLQKCLLYFESLHGRPSGGHERSVIAPFYERYRLLKQLLRCCPSPTPITTIEEEEGSDEDHPKEHSPAPGSVSPGAPSPAPSLETPPVSPLEEVQCLQTQVVTMATLHEASRSELLNHLRITRLEKRRIHRALREFEDLFYTLSGRVCQKEDRGPMAEEYCQYKNLKAKLRLLEALLSKKQETAKSS